MNKFTFAAVLALVATTAAGAADQPPPAEHTYTLTESGLKRVFDRLIEMPVKYAMPIIQDLQQQAQDSDRAVKKAEAKK